MRTKPIRKRMPLETVEKVLRLCRDKHFDCNVRHFHEKLQEVDELLLGRYIERGAGRGLQLHCAWILDATWTHSKLNTEMEPRGSRTSN